MMVSKLKIQICFLITVFCTLVVYPVFAQEGTPDKPLPKEKQVPGLKDTVPVPGKDNPETVVADLENRLGVLEEKISKLESEAIGRKLETSQSYLEELNELKVGKDVLKVKISKLRAASQQELEELEKDAQKSLDELEKTYQIIVNEINKDKPGR